MPLVTALPQTNSDGTITRQFIDCVSTTVTTYTYSIAQDNFELWNKGNVNITLNVGGYIGIVILPKTKWVNDTSFTGFDISAPSICEFSITTRIYNSINSQMADITSKLYNKNVQLSNQSNNLGEVVEDFEDKTLWTSSTITLEDDIANFKFGSKALKLTATAAGYSSADKTINYTIGNSKIVSLWVYCYNLNFGAIFIYFSSNAFTTYVNYGIYPATLKVGWNLVRMNIADFASTGGAVATESFTKMRVAFNGATIGASVSLDCLKKQGIGQPKVIFTFDDVYTSQYDKVLPYFNSKGITGSLSVISSFINTGGSYMSLQQLQAFKDAGWDLCNHNDGIASMTTYGTKDLYNTLSICNNYLLNNLNTNGRLVVSYPNGAYNDNVITTLQNMGYVGARATDGKVQWSPIEPSEYYTLSSIALSTTFATNKAFADTAIKNGGILIFYAHDMDAVTFTQLQQIVEYLMANSVQFLKMSDLFY